MNDSRSPVTYLVAAAVATIATLIAEAVFDDEINWVTVILIPFATVVGIMLGDAIRQRR